MSAFRALAASAFVALDATFGEPLMIAPQLVGQFIAAGPDPANPAFAAVGILDVEGVIVDGAGVKTGARSEVETSKPVVEFDAAQFGASGRPLPVRGTFITATSRPGAPVFVVVDDLPDGQGRIVFQLAARS